ncbi:aminodeoxychorismate lyase [Coniochaeta sp. PMI_546]|nr:aminodeoxychorismate lyase [Coniochaeta sp. PMI_546]
MANNFHIFTSLRYDLKLNIVPTRKLEYAGWNHAHESPFYMLDLHRDRLLRAAKHWQWDKAVEALEGDAGLQGLSDFLTRSLAELQETPRRVKVMVSAEGVLGCESSHVPETPLENLFPQWLPDPAAKAEAGFNVPSKELVYEVLVDKVKTRRSEYTHFKTSQRDMYDEARQRAGIRLGDKKEVLLVETDGSIMEGSTTTPYFWRNGTWVTPPVSSRFSSPDGSGGNDGTTRRWALQRGIAVEDVVKADSIEEEEECWLSNGVRGFMFGKIKLG